MSLPSSVGSWPPSWLARPLDVSWRALLLFIRSNGWSWAGAVGLFLFLSVPPLMVASAFLASLLFTQAEANFFVLTQASKFVPAQADLLHGVLLRDEPIATGAGLVSLAFLLFAGSRAFAALASAINRMYGRTGQFSFWDTQRSRAWLLALSLVLLALTGAAEAGISAITGTRAGEQVWLLEWQLLPFILIGVFFFIAYRVLPEAEVTWQHAAIGAAVSTVGIRISQAVMGTMSDMGTFESPYGALAGVGLMATWAFVVGVAVLLGESIVAVRGGYEEDDARPSED